MLYSRHQPVRLPLGPKWRPNNPPSKSSIFRCFALQYLHVILEYFTHLGYYEILRFEIHITEDLIVLDV